jgi:hypothetical protein
VAQILVACAQFGRVLSVFPDVGVVMRNILLVASAAARLDGGQALRIVPCRDRKRRLAVAVRTRQHRCEKQSNEYCDWSLAFHSTSFGFIAI